MALDEILRLFMPQYQESFHIHPTSVLSEFPLDGTIPGAKNQESQGY